MGEVALPLTILGVGLAAIGQTMDTDSTKAKDLSTAVRDFISDFEGSAKGVDTMDAALRKWGKDASDYGGTGLNELSQAARQSGQDFAGIADAIVTKNLPALEKAARESNELAQTYEHNSTVTTNSWNGEEKAFLAKRDAANTVTSALDNQIAAVKEANDAETVMATSMHMTLSQYKAYNDVIQLAKDANSKLTDAQEKVIKTSLQQGESSKTVEKNVKDYAAVLKEASDDHVKLSADQRDGILTDLEVGESVSQLKKNVSDYAAVLSDAKDQHVTLTAAQKATIQSSINAGQSASDLKGQIDAYADALKQSKQDQTDWDSSVQGSFQSAASASDDWADSSKVDLDQVATNLTEASKQIERLPDDINKALQGGLSQTGLKLLESLPNGQQIIDQIGLDPGSADSKKLIAAANQAGQDAGKSVSDGLTKTPPLTLKTKVDTSGADGDLKKFDGKVKTIDVKVNTDTTDADQALKIIGNKTIKPKVKPVADTSDVDDALKIIGNKTIKPSVQPKADMSGVNAALASLGNRTVSITVVGTTRDGKRVF